MTLEINTKIIIINMRKWIHVIILICGPSCLPMMNLPCQVNFYLGEEYHDKGYKYIDVNNFVYVGKLNARVFGHLKWVAWLCWEK